MLDQLFDKLDTDRDGRVSFDELLQLFQSGSTLPSPSPGGSPSPSSSPPLSSSPHQVTINITGQPTFTTENGTISPTPHPQQHQQTKKPSLHKVE